MIMKGENEVTRAFAEHAAEKIRLRTSARMSPEMLEDMGVKAAADWMTGDLMLSIEARMLGREVREEAVDHVDVPRSWWDHLKDTLLTRSPWLKGIIRHVRRDRFLRVSKVYHTCPHLPGEARGTHLRWLASEREEG